MILQLVCSVLIAAQPASYLERTAVALEKSRGDALDMQPIVEEAAKRICAGGKLYAAGNPSLISEMSGRAGGLMLTASLGNATPATADAVIFFADAEHPFPAKLAESGAAITLFGAKTESDKVHGVPPRAEEFGLSPTLSMAIQGWLFTAELVSACTRLHKMPVIFESIGLYGGIPRMQQYQGKGIFFHEKCEVPEIASGDLANDYIKRVAAMLRRCLKEHRADFDRAGMWARNALASGNKPTMYSMGHLFPSEVANTAIGQDFRSAEWNAAFSYLKHPEDTYGKGDLVIHIGYQHAPLPMLEEAKRDGAHAVYVSVVKDRDYPTGTNVIWIDPMWPFADACVPLDGYDIPAFAASGVVNAAIAWEIERLAQAESH